MIQALAVCRIVSLPLFDILPILTLMVNSRVLVNRRSRGCVVPGRHLTIHDALLPKG